MIAPPFVEAFASAPREPSIEIDTHVSISLSWE
jgi:hypothetical protein